jgi:nucleoside-diphosphate-sugar epimerase
MTNPSILITGANGFIGRHVFAECLAKTIPTTILVRHRNGDVESPTICADLTKELGDFSKHQFSLVYHLAGLAHITYQTDADRKSFFEVNTRGTQNLLRALETCRSLPESFVLISTVAVYGCDSGELLDETTPCRPQDAYGSSKLQAESLAEEWGLLHGVRVAILRLPLVVGQQAPGNLATMTKAIREGHYFGIGRGESRRSMVSVRDVARILPVAARVGGIYHLTDGIHPSIGELERAIAEALGKRSPRHLPERLVGLGALAGDCFQKIFRIPLTVNSRTFRKLVTTLTFSDHKAQQLLNWQPEPVLPYLKETIRVDRSPKAPIA